MTFRIAVAMVIGVLAGVIVAVTSYLITGQANVLLAAIIAAVGTAFSMGGSKKKSQR